MVSPSRVLIMWLGWQFWGRLGSRNGPPRSGERGRAVEVVSRGMGEDLRFSICDLRLEWGIGDCQLPIAEGGRGFPFAFFHLGFAMEGRSGLGGGGGLIRETASGGGVLDLGGYRRQVRAADRR